MTAKSEWKEYLDNMYSQAFQEFHRTGHCLALRETLDRMERDCQMNFRADDFAYINAWMDALMMMNSAECVFMYERGYRDCVDTLKQLEVI